MGPPPGREGRAHREREPRSTANGNKVAGKKAAGTSVVRPKRWIVAAAASERPSPSPSPPRPSSTKSPVTHPIESLRAQRHGRRGRNGAADDGASPPAPPPEHGRREWATGPCARRRCTAALAGRRGATARRARRGPPTWLRPIGGGLPPACPVPLVPCARMGSRHRRRASAGRPAWSVPFVTTR